MWDGRGVKGDSIVEHPTAVKQKINLSPQETAVAPKLSVQENLELIARIYGSNKSEARSKTDAIMQAFGLSDRSKDKAKTLSGGCLLYTSDAADERSRVDLGGRRIIKKKNKQKRQGEE